MAERRMFAKTIIDSDAFLEMPTTSQLLYFHLSMRADDDGFINKPISIMRMVGCKDDDLKILFAKKFLIPFESGVVVIKHWRIHNYIRKDTYTETKYKEEKRCLSLGENSEYRLVEANPSRSRDEAVTGTLTQDRIGQDSLVKDSIVEENISPPAAPTKPIRHKYGMYNNVLLSDEDMEKLRTEFPHDYSDRIERLSEYIASTGKSYKSHLATIRSWARKEPKKTMDNSSFDTDEFFGQAVKKANKRQTSSNPFLDMLKNGEV